METLVGAHIKQLDFIPFKHGDLLYHEGPLLSHFKDTTNEDVHYLYKWSDCNELINRWMIIKVTPYTLIEFLSKKISLRQVITNQAFVYLIDLSNEHSIGDITIVAIDSLPEGYLPSEDSIYDEDEYEDYAKTLRVRLKSQLFKNLKFASQAPRSTSALTWDTVNVDYNDFLEINRIPFDPHNTRFSNIPHKYSSYYYKSLYPYRHRTEMWPNNDAIQVHVFNGKSYIVVDIKDNVTLEKMLLSLNEQLKENPTY